MKSLTAVCQTGASMPAMKPQSGRVSRPPQHRANGENAEMRMYLSKLKDLVPFMPKNRKLSKLEIIQHVIDYICELQTELESHPDIDSYDGARELLATPNRHFALDLVNHAAAAAAAANGTTSGNNHHHHDNDNDNDDNDNDEYDEQEDHDVNMLSNVERLAAESANQQQQQQQLQQQQQQQSSPAARQPLVDRNVPNTFVPSSAAIQLPQTPVSAAAAVSAVTTPAVAAVATATGTITAPATQQSTPMVVTSEKEQSQTQSQSRRNC